MLYKELRTPLSLSLKMFYIETVYHNILGHAYMNKSDVRKMMPK